MKNLQEENLFMFYREIVNNEFCKYIAYCYILLFTVFPEIYEQVKKNNKETDYYAHFEL